MNNIAREVLGLSAGTVAKLCGSADYATIDAFRDAWVIWCIDNAADCKTWQDAWFAYSAR
jgi:hypothetical protein